MQIFESLLRTVREYETKYTSILFLENHCRSFPRFADVRFIPRSIAPLFCCDPEMRRLKGEQVLSDMQFICKQAAVDSRCSTMDSLLLLYRTLDNGMLHDISRSVWTKLLKYSRDLGKPTHEHKTNTRLPSASSNVAFFLFQTSAKILSTTLFFSRWSVILRQGTVCAT